MSRISLTANRRVGYALAGLLSGLVVGGLGFAVACTPTGNGWFGGKPHNAHPVVKKAPTKTSHGHRVTTPTVTTTPTAPTTTYRFGALPPTEDIPPTPPTTTYSFGALPPTEDIPPAPPSTLHSLGALPPTETIKPPHVTTP